MRRSIRPARLRNARLSFRGRLQKRRSSKNQDAGPCQLQALVRRRCAYPFPGGRDPHSSNRLPSGSVAQPNRPYSYPNDKLSSRGR